MSAHDSSKRRCASTWWTNRPGATSSASLPRPTPNASAREWAASVESTKVRLPARAARVAVAAATVDLPTPPLPVKRRIRVICPPGRPSAERLDALLQALERGVDEDLLALALEHPDQRDRHVEREPVGHVGPAVGQRGQDVGTVEGAEHLALDQSPGDLLGRGRDVLEGVLV